MFSRYFPKISIIIPIFEHTEFFAETLASIYAQRYPALEVIAVDDGSSETSAQKIQEICARHPKTLLIQQDNQGSAVARHTGLQKSTGEYVMFFDADDVALPHALKTLLKGFKRHPDAVACYAQLRRIDTAGKFLSEARPNAKQMCAGEDVAKSLLSIKPLFQGGSILIKRAALMKLEVNNAGVQLGEDWMLWCHLAISGKIIPAAAKVVMLYRIHTNNQSHKAEKDYRLTYECFERIYTDSRIIAHMGKEKARAFLEHSKNTMHINLASYHAKYKNTEQAKYHLARIRYPVSTFQSRINIS